MRVQVDDPDEAWHTAVECHTNSFHVLGTKVVTEEFEEMVFLIKYIAERGICTDEDVFWMGTGFGCIQEISRRCGCWPKIQTKFETCVVECQAHNFHAG